MMLTGVAGEAVEDTHVSSIIVGKGIAFEIDFKPMIALDTVEIFFTGLVLHSYPPQVEIDRIVGRYQPKAIRPFKLSKTGIEWGGPNRDWYWFYWWTPLEQNHRYWGIRQDWHDGPINHIGFWWFNLSWSLPWTRYFWRNK